MAVSAGPVPAAPVTGPAVMAVTVVMRRPRAMAVGVVMAALAVALTATALLVCGTVCASRFLRASPAPEKSHA